MRKVIKLLLVPMMAVIMASCASNKDYVYLQDMKVLESYAAQEKQETVIRQNDHLAIFVSSKNQELAEPFNLNNVLLGNVLGNSGSTSTKVPNYRVDSEGNVELPILGKVRVEGKTISQIKDIITQKIIDSKYVKDPVVSVDLLNFKYTVLGAIGSGVTYATDNEVTLLDAIAKAGDLAGNADVKKVLVIRYENGKRTVYQHDLRSKDIFDSPAYYLQQNDIVYVVPKYKRRNVEDRIMRYVSEVTSLISFGLLIWNVTK